MTVSLVVPAALIWLVASVVLGSISALRVGGLADRGLMVAAILGVSIPVFLLAAVLLYVFAFKLPWFPRYGLHGPFQANPAQWASPSVPALDLDRDPVDRLLLPGCCAPTCSNMVNEDFVRTARQGPHAAAGVRAPRAAQLADADRHDVGLDFAVLLGGAALVTETVFNLPGIGQYKAQAIGNLDVPPIMVGAMFTAFFVVLFSAFSDIVYALLNPRVRLTG